MADIKRMSIKEFRELGFLQEANRLFFHPLGLALEVRTSEDGEYTLGGIQDAREDETGYEFGIADMEEERKAEMKTKANFVTAEFKKRDANRIAAYGNRFEPIK